MADECWFTHPEDPEWDFSSTSRRFKKDADDRYRDSHRKISHSRTFSATSSRRESKHTDRDASRHRHRSRSRSISPVRSSPRKHEDGSPKSHRLRESIEFNAGRTIKEAKIVVTTAMDIDIQPLSPAYVPQTPLIEKALYSMQQAVKATPSNHEPDISPLTPYVPPPPSSVPPPKPLPEIPSGLTLNIFPSPTEIPIDKKTEIWTEKVKCVKQLHESKFTSLILV